jgi:ATP-dependent protease ClpP protease subunit
MRFKLFILSMLLGFMSSLSAEESILLTETNHASIITNVSEESVAAAILQLNSLTESKLYLYINSQGGDVIAGLVLVDYLRNSGKDITCIAKVAISMAHVILEACPVRVGTPDNRLMQHRLSTGAEGSPDDIAGQANQAKGLELYLDTLEANRIGVTVEEFQRRASKPWFTFGSESLRENLVDRLSYVQCHTNLFKKSSKKEVITMFGAVNIVTNGCPLIPILVVPVEAK